MIASIRFLSLLFRNNSVLVTASRSLIRNVVFLLVLMTTSSVVGQDKPISIESSRMQPPLVLGRPMLTWWDVKIQSSSLVVGKFEFTIKSDSEFLGLTETEELTLNGPEQRIRVMLPSIVSSNLIEQLDVEIKFRGRNFSGDLGKQLLRVPFAKKRVFIGLAAESSNVRKTSPQREQLLDRLRFENIVLESSAFRNAETDREHIKTFYVSVSPADLPAEPLSYCSYDVVILAGDEFQVLRKPQLEALLAWLKAGGSLYVEPSGVLEPYHVEFLRNLVADDPRGIVFQVDPNGKLPQDDVDANAPTISVVCGIGQAVIERGDPNRKIDLSNDSWRTVARTLWKSRTQILETPSNPELYRRVGIELPAIEGRFVDSDPNSLANSLETVSRFSHKELLERLLPEGVRMLPLSLLCAILFGFILLIGPGDYYVLGWLRLRKYTWVTFPMTTLIVTVLTVYLSNRYMTAAESRRTVTVRDLGPGGDVVRTNRFELLFVASSRWATINIEKGLFAPLKAGNVQLDPVTGGQTFRATGAGDLDFDSMTVRTTGRLPTAYAVHQNVAKWTPQINRFFSIPGAVEKLDVDWTTLDLQAADANLLRQHSIPDRLIEQVQQLFGQQAMVACFTDKDGWANDHSQGWRSSRLQPETRANMLRFNRGPNSTQAIPELRSASDHGESEFFLWLYQISVAFPGSGVFPSAASGIFSLVSRTAPKGSSNCDDLPLLDSSDSQSWLLVVVVPDQDDLIVYRKLMRFE